MEYRISTRNLGALRSWFETLRRIFHRICVAISVSLSCLWTIFCTLGCVGSSFLNPQWPHLFQRLWGYGICVFFGIRIEVKGLEKLKGGGVILIPNHSSIFDIFILSSLPVNFKWISKVEVGKIPFLGSSMRALGVYFIRRDRSAHDKEVMARVERGARSGQSILLFPEGTRTTTGDLLPFKKGAFRLAKSTGLPLCPVAISGTFTIAKPKSFPTSIGHSVYVQFGDLIRVPEDMSVEQALFVSKEALERLLRTRAS